MTLEWKPFSVKPILVHPLLCKQDKLVFCFRLQSLSHAQVQLCFERMACVCERHKHEVRGDEI